MIDYLFYGLCVGVLFFIFFTFIGDWKQKLTAFISIVVFWIVGVPYAVHLIVEEVENRDNVVILGTAYTIAYLVLNAKLYFTVLESPNLLWLFSFILVFIVWTIPLLSIINKLLQWK